jgi:hypothetical protein
MLRRRISGFTFLRTKGALAGHAASDLGLNFLGAPLLERIGAAARQQRESA